MPDVLAAIDETAGSDILMAAEAMLGTLSNSGSTSFGPFTVSHSESATLSGGSVMFSPPATVSVNNCRLDYSLSFTFGFDLNSILPHGCLPQICFPTPWGDICTPKICLSWPTISIPVSYSDHLMFSADFGLGTHLTAGNWIVDITILAVPTLNLGPAATALIAAIGLAVAAALLVVPLIGPFLALAVAAIVGVFAIASATGFLGALLTPFISGLKFTLFSQPQTFPILPAAAPDPAVMITINALSAMVETAGKNELVLSVDV
jgi:hypothetical protein